MDFQGSGKGKHIGIKIQQHKYNIQLKSIWGMFCGQIKLQKCKYLCYHVRLQNRCTYRCWYGRRTSTFLRHIPYLIVRGASTINTVRNRKTQCPQKFVVLGDFSERNSLLIFIRDLCLKSDKSIYR